MSRTTYDIQESYTGNGSVSAYTFSFKVEEASQILVVERDASLVETRRETGDNPVTLISSVTFDDEAGGGTVTLSVNLVSGYKLDIFLANDAPTQPSVFRDKFSYTLKNIENALDWIGGAVQRASFLAQRSVKLKDVLSLASFDVNLPVDIVGSVSKSLVTNAAGDALEMGPTSDEISNAQGYATAAAASAAAAALSAAAAALEAAVGTTITDGLSAATITGYTFDPASTEWVDIPFSIYRGATVVGSGKVEMVYDSSAWHIFEKSYDYPTGKSALHGLTFSMSGNELQVASDSGAGAGKLFTRAFQA